MRLKYLTSLTLVMALILSGCAKQDGIVMQTIPGGNITECGVDAAEEIVLHAGEDKLSSNNIEIVYANTDKPVKEGTPYTILIPGMSPTTTSHATTTTTVKPKTTTTTTTQPVEILEGFNPLSNKLDLITLLSLMQNGLSVSDNNLSVGYRHKNFAEVVACNGTMVACILGSTDRESGEVAGDVLPQAILGFDEASYYLDLDSKVAACVFSLDELGITQKDFQSWAESWKKDGVSKYFCDKFKVKAKKQKEKEVAATLSEFGIYWGTVEEDTTTTTTPVSDEFVIPAETTPAETTPAETTTTTTTTLAETTTISSETTATTTKAKPSSASDVSFKSSGNSSFPNIYCIYDNVAESVIYTGSGSILIGFITDKDMTATINNKLSQSIIVPNSRDYYTVETSAAHFDNITDPYVITGTLDSKATNNMTYDEFTAWADKLKDGEQCISLLDYIKDLDTIRKETDTTRPIIDTTSREYETQCGKYKVIIETFTSPQYYTNIPVSESLSCFRVYVSRDKDSDIKLKEYRRELDMKVFADDEELKLNEEMSSAFAGRIVQDYNFYLDAATTSNITLQIAGDKYKISMSDLFNAPEVGDAGES